MFTDGSIIMSGNVTTLMEAGPTTSVDMNVGETSVPDIAATVTSHGRLLATFSCQLDHSTDES